MPFDLLAGTWIVKGAAFVAAVALLLGARAKPLPVCLVVAAAVVTWVGLTARLFPTLGFDYHIFWQAGREVWAGRNPYAPERFADLPFLNPPTALPLFALFALAPFGVSFLVWTLLNALACLVLLSLGQSVLVAQEEQVGLERSPFALRLPPLVLLGMTPALLVSDAFLVSFYLGQLGLLAAVALLAALRSQARGRPVLAGVWLALATVKPATMLPFLLLFHRKSDRWTWVALAGAVLALCLATGSPAEQPDRLTTLLERIRALESPGRVNDYSFEGPRSENMLGFDHAFYRLGLRDRRVIGAAQYLALALLGAWVAVRVLGRRRLPRGAACSLVALYSVVFLYHRNYDTLILALPFAFSAAGARSAKGRARWWFFCCSLAILLVWYLDIGLLRALQQHSPDWGGWGWLAQAAVLPCGTWLILLAMICLAAATRRAGEGVTRAGASHTPPTGEGRASPEP
jgi:hypothetical protein